MVNWNERSLADDGKYIRAVFRGALEARKEGLRVHVCLYTLAHVLSVHACHQAFSCGEGNLDS